jgi:hypothetical protein
LVRLFNRSLRRSNQARDRLRSAYVAVFSGNGKQEDAELVLADLANYSRYYQVPSERAILSKQVDLSYRQGQRVVFARILRFLEMPEAQAKALEEAARSESIADQEHKQEI